MEFDGEGNWTLYLGGDVIADGYLQYEPEWESIYAYNYQDGSGGRFALEDSGRLYISTYGYFNYGDGMEYIWYDNGGGDHDGDQPENDYRLTEDDESYPNDGGNEFYSWNSELYQRNVSEFEGVWYYDGNLSAETYIVRQRRWTAASLLILPMKQALIMRILQCTTAFLSVYLNSMMMFWFGEMKVLTI